MQCITRPLILPLAEMNHDSDKSTTHTLHPAVLENGIPLGWLTTRPVTPYGPDRTARLRMYVFRKADTYVCISELPCSEGGERRNHSTIRSFGTS